ncbi:hypothetical protein [Cylindrospermopsis raciborskii]|uniref:hypothetical protein n=1 Tax=Cylindrospermopsis raciborskii TaxID=77022 RepID=UPI0015E0BF73|nr:hypothetical protein [Cylindrospermopsis raciborskii]
MAHLPNLGIDPEDSAHKPHSSATLGDRDRVYLPTKTDSFFLWVNHWALVKIL